MSEKLSLGDSVSLMLIQMGTTESAKESLMTLKDSFPKHEDIPCQGIVAKCMFPVLFASGVCDLQSFDVRTGGQYHDLVEEAISSLGPTTESNLTEWTRELVREKNKQKLLAALDEASINLNSGKIPPEKAYELITEALGQVAAPTSVKSWESHVEDATQLMARMAEKGCELKTPLANLNSKFVMRRGNMTVVGAPTSHGKTAFMISCVAIPALRAGLRVCYLCFEDFHVFPYKFASSMFGVPLQYFMSPHTATEEQRAQATTALKLSKEYQKRLRVLPDTELPALDAEVRAQKADVVILDYLQKYAEVFYGDGEKREACGKITSRFQDIGRKHNCYTLLASQVRRREIAKVNKETSTGVLRRPSLSDLKESGDIENYADAALLLWWPAKDVCEDQNVKYDMGRYCIQIAKDKLGPGGDIECRFTGETLSFKDKYSIATS